MKLQTLRAALPRYQQYLFPEDFLEFNSILDAMEEENLTKKLEGADMVIASTGYLIAKYEGVLRHWQDQETRSRALNEGAARTALAESGGRITEAMILGHLLGIDEYAQLHQHVSLVTELRDLLKTLHNAASARQFLLTEVSRYERETTRE